MHHLFGHLDGRFGMGLFLIIGAVVILAAIVRKESDK